MSFRHPPMEGRAGKLRLDLNENTQGCSPAARAALARLTRGQLAMYPAYETTRARLARYFRVAPEELLLANGADDALGIVAGAYLKPGRRVLLVEPTFPMYRFYAQLAAAKVEAVRYDPAMRLPLEAVLRALRRRPAVFFLANPNNPTGTLVERPALRRFLEAASATTVVVDEAYAEFSGVTVLPWIRKHRNLVVLRTFSKAAGLAGLRLGCLMAHRELVAALRGAQVPFPVNTAALAAAEAAVRDTAHLRRVVGEIRRSKRDLEEGLTGLGARVFPSGGNFLLADLGPRGPQLVRALERRGVLLRDCAEELGRAGFVRITVGTRRETHRLLAALRLTMKTQEK